MRSRERLPQRDRATYSARGRQSETRPYFATRRRARRKQLRGRDREHGCKELPRRQFRSRACLFAELAREPSANKEQRPQIYERKNFESPLGGLITIADQSCSTL